MNCRHEIVSDKRLEELNCIILASEKGNEYCRRCPSFVGVLNSTASGIGTLWSGLKGNESINQSKRNGTSFSFNKLPLWHCSSSNARHCRTLLAMLCTLLSSSPLHTWGGRERSHNIHVHYPSPLACGSWGRPCQDCRFVHWIEASVRCKEPGNGPYFDKFGEQFIPLTETLYETFHEIEEKYTTMKSRTILNWIPCWAQAIS